MHYIVSYDITSDKRRNKTAKILLDFGVRVQYSVFEADLTEELFQNMRKRLLKAIDEENDNLVIYRLCNACVAKKESFGKVQIIEDKDFYIL